MSKLSGAKKKMGRPTVDSVAVNVRVERDLIEQLDAWIATQSDQPSRPEAVRRLMKTALIPK
jgi:metal-responsive CopG/Arc/MetJ family transcriptional regulator